MEWQTKQIRRTYNRLGLGMLAYLLIYQFLSLPLMLVVKLLCPQLLSSSWFGLLLGELVQYAVALPVCWWIAKSANTPQRPLSRRKLSVSCFFKYLLLSIGLLFLFNLIGTAVNELLSQLKGSPAGNLIEQSVGSYTLWQMVLVTVISAAINRGDKTAVKTVFQQDFTDIEKRLLQSGEDYIAMLEEALAGYGRYLDLLQARAEPDLIIQAFNEYQLLCALREGPFGVAGLNERIEQFMQQKRKIHRHPHSRWYEGRPVMIARNDSALGLFNGDIGIALDRGQGTRVWFAMPDGNIKSVQPSRLPEHETTWAMTVHKSQGSEFDHAALILPSQRTPVVTRELVYTAVTRARRRLSLYADERILSAAIATRTERRSGLAALFSSRE